MGFEVFLLLLMAAFLDLLLGDPVGRPHPTIVLGRLASALREKAPRGAGSRTAYGLLVFLLVAVGYALSVYAVLRGMEGIHPLLPVLAGALFLKLQFTWRGLGDYTLPISARLREGDLEGAKEWLPYLVGRRTEDLDERLTLSAAIESIGENFVDGVLSPLLFYLLLAIPSGIPAGVAGAALYRGANTLDSMLGYRKEGYREIGFFPARIDDLFNYLPARISPILILLAALLRGEDWRGAGRVFWRDRKKTPSPNSGHPMAAVAGALGVRLEKAGSYALGEEGEPLTPDHIPRTLRLVSLSLLLFLFAAFGLYEVTQWL
jgi:adenosylcobinamide-phosphate synthase